MNTSYIAVHKTKGIYLGVVSGYGLFSEAGMAFTSKAIRFDSKEEIHSFFDSVLPNISKEIEPVEIRTNGTGNYVDVVDILKSGYYDHTDSMVEALPIDNDTIH